MSKRPIILDQLTLRLMRVQAPNTAVYTIMTSEVGEEARYAQWENMPVWVDHVGCLTDTYIGTKYAVFLSKPVVSRNVNSSLSNEFGNPHRRCYTCKQPLEAPCPRSSTT